MSLIQHRGNICALVRLMFNKLWLKNFPISFVDIIIMKHDFVRVSRTNQISDTIDKSTPNENNTNCTLRIKKDESCVRVY